MKTENWNGNTIRFVDVDSEWWAVAKDVSDALQYSDAKQMVKRIPNRYTWTVKMPVQGQDRKMLTLNEFGVYKAIFNSRKPEAQEFQEWIFDVIKQLRTSTGLEGFEVFRMLDKEHQKRAMQKLTKGMQEPNKKDYIKANTIANKAVSNKYGYPKMVKKGNMTPEMLVDREEVLNDAVELMAVKDKYRLPISVSKEVYKKVGV